MIVEVLVYVSIDVSISLLLVLLYEVEKLIICVRHFRLAVKHH